MNDNPYESPNETADAPRESAFSKIRSFDLIVVFTALGCITEWLLLPERFGPFQYPLGRPDVAVGGFAGLCLGVVVVVYRKLLISR